MPVSEGLQTYSDKMMEMLSPHVADDVKMVQKGMMLYRQGMVTSLKIDKEMNSVMGTVQDVIPVKVTLDLTFPGLSECSCPTDEICRHQLAVFFSAYGREASVAEWIEEWREPIHEVKSVTQWGIQRAKDLVKDNGILKPDYERWLQLMDISFDSILKSKKYTNPYIVGELFDIYVRRLWAGMPLEQEWKTLYQLIANVISFKKLAELSEELGYSEDTIKRSYLHLFHTLMDDAEDLTLEIGHRTLPFDFDQFVEKFSRDTIDLLTCTQGLEFERIALYRMLWTHFFKKKEWFAAEYERIETRLKELPDEQNPLPLFIAKIHLSLLEGEDDRALELMNLVPDEQLVPYLLYWIDYLTSQKAWKRLGPLVDTLIAKIRKYLDLLDFYHANTGFVRLATKAISPYCLEMNRIDLYERALMQTLPYSFYEYEDLLFSRGQYDKWIELNSFIGIRFSDLSSDRIKQVEKEQPEVLLSILHQTVQTEIEMKNRQSYKIAVRHLKKLRTLYKKTKRLDDWQFFFQTLLEKTKRLRAFQEECKRSKLIDA